MIKPQRFLQISYTVETFRSHYNSADKVSKIQKKKKSIKKQANAKALLRHVLVLRNSSNHNANNAWKVETCCGTKGKMLTSRK